MGFSPFAKKIILLALAKIYISKIEEKNEK